LEAVPGGDHPVGLGRRDIGPTPLPFVDFIPLVALQISMVLAVGRIYSYRITWRRASCWPPSASAHWAGPCSTN
jgi:hypothetical protein